MRNRSRSLLFVGSIVALFLASTSPTAAECGFPLTPMPPFDKVAARAERIVVGQVIDDLERSPGDPMSDAPLVAFRLEVQEVIRGSAPDTLDILALRTRAPNTSRCPDVPFVYATVGDVIAIAFNGRMPGVRHPVTAAAWIEGQPDRYLVPQAQQLTLARVRVLGREALPPTDTVDRDDDPRGGTIGILGGLGVLAAAVAGAIAFRRRDPGQSHPV
jgi:hypothetical protein